MTEKFFDPEQDALAEAILFALCKRLNGYGDALFFSHEEIREAAANRHYLTMEFNAKDGFTFVINQNH